MLVLTAAIVMASTGAVQAQDAKAGEAVFKRYCFPCHDAGPNAKVKLGPPLNGLNGRKSGTIPGFNYSDANKNSGIVWSAATFADYIQNPMQRMPGTRMAFAGLRDKKDIANLWAYLSQFDDKGAKK
jgi:cytochrome c